MHLLVESAHENSAMLLIIYKDWSDNTHTHFKISQTFSSPWVATSELSLAVQGQSLSRIYDNFVAQISGIGEHKAGIMAEIVTLKLVISKMEAELLALQKKMRREPQLDIQMKKNKQVKAKRKELTDLKEQLEKLK